MRRTQRFFDNGKGLLEMCERLILLTQAVKMTPRLLRPACNVGMKSAEGTLLNRQRTFEVFARCRFPGGWFDSLPCSNGIQGSRVRRFDTS